MRKREKIIVYVMVLMVLVSISSFEVTRIRPQNKFATRDLVAKQNVTQGTLVEVKGNNILAKVGRNIYTILTTAYTEVKDKAGNLALLENFKSGEQLLIKGTVDKKKSLIVASEITGSNEMNQLLPKLFFGTFMGIVISVGMKGLVMESISRGKLAVLFDRKNSYLLAKEIRKGDKIRVVGLWDEDGQRITDVERMTIG